MDYSYSYIDEGRVVCSLGSAVAVNLSEGGLGLLTDRPFERGQGLKLFIKQLSSEPITAQVQWCTKLSETVYKLGLMFS